MSEGHLPTASAPHAPDAFALLADAEALLAAIRRLALVTRTVVDEHARMMRLHAAGRIDVLDAWRASLDLLEHVVSGTENTARIASESLIIAVRAMEGLPPRPRGR
jgi:hypothetical protein